MYQIDVPTAIAGLPTPAAEGTAGFFTDGNPATGTPATIVPADFLNMMMQELINVALEGAAPLSKSSYTQVRDAISNMVANASAGVGQVTNVTGVAPINSSGGATPAISISAATDSAPGSMSAADKTKLDGIAAGATANAGTVTAVTVTSANGVSASVANQGTTPALTIALGAITPTSISCGGTVSGAGANFSGTSTFAKVNSSIGTDSRSFNVPNVHGNAGAHYGGVVQGIYSVYNAYYNGVWNQEDATQAAGGYNFSSSNGSHSFMYSAPGGTMTTVASIDSSGGFTCTTMNATSSDRRLKRNIRKFAPRPLHRSVPFVSYVLKENGWHGLGSIAQRMQNTAPEHVGEFDWHGKKRLSLNYAGAAYEQAMWAGRELDRQAKLIEKQAKLITKLEARLAKLERRA